MRLRRLHRALLPLAAALAVVLAGACSSSTPTLYIGGIPDQDASVLQDRFDSLAEYLSDETGLPVRYQPSSDYAAVVTAFKQGDLHMGWYGGLTGVQARLAVPDARAVAQRPLDEEFHSVFIARKALGVTSLEDLKGRTFTFGSESSTSGRLMPAYYLAEAGIDPDKDFRAVNFSGSHDKTWKLVEAGAFDAGALNANVWETRVEAGDVDLGKVEAFWTTPAYYGYHWVLRGDLAGDFGEDAQANITRALLALDAGNGDSQSKIMEAFQAERFIPTQNDNYRAIENVARILDIIR